MHDDISFYSIESTPSPVTPSPSRGRLYLYACSAEISALKTTHDLHVPSVAMNGVVGIAKFNNQTLIIELISIYEGALSWFS